MQNCKPALKFDWEDEQYAKEIEALENPRPGDAWHEMLCVVALVCQVTDEAVLLCKNPYADRQEAEWISREDFKIWPKYGRLSNTWDKEICHKHWCNLLSRKHLAYVDPRLRPILAKELNIYDRDTEGGAMHAAWRDWVAREAPS